MNEAIDQDGNVIREGMSIMCHREEWIVTHIDSYRGRLTWVVADRVMSNGRKCRLIVGRKRLRAIHVIGFQYPRITYP